MNRVQRLKENKSRKRRFAGLLLLVFSIVFVGIGVTDYSFNSLMKNEKCVKVVSFKYADNSCLEISLMNSRLYLNIKYIERDIQKLKNRFSRFINS